MNIQQLQTTVNVAVNRLKEMDKLVSELNSEAQPKFLLDLLDSSGFVYGLDGLVNGGPVEKLASVGLILTDYNKQPATQGLFSYVVGICRIKRIGFKEHLRRSVLNTVAAAGIAAVK